MNVCYFGTYEKNYPSNRIIIKGLRKNGIKVIECHVCLWEKYQNKHGDFLKLFSMLKIAINFAVAYVKLCFMFFSKCKNVDVFIVGYIGQLDILFLKVLLLLKKNKPKILFIPLVSLYDTAIADRGLSDKNNLFAKFLFYIDKLSFKMADLIIFDTNEHINYISNLFNLDKSKFKRVWVGADEDVFYPQCSFSGKWGAGGVFTVLFIGKYIPLHGIEHIIKTAKILEGENINFKLVGNGQLYKKMRDLSDELEVKNIDFVEWIEYNELSKEIGRADVVLGIFGGSEKASRVIPNKVFQAIACRKAVVTGDTLAVRELFMDRENIFLCKNRDPESIRSAILELKNNSDFKDRLAERGYLIYEEKLTTEKIGSEFVKLLN